MAQKFIGKKLHKKYVRPMLNSRIPRKVSIEQENDNKQQINDGEMNNEQLNKIETILGNEIPKKKVKVIKKDKGLIEREEKATILITEDNKMILND